MNDSYFYRPFRISCLSNSDRNVDYLSTSADNTLLTGIPKPYDYDFGNQVFTKTKSDNNPLKISLGSRDRRVQLFLDPDPNFLFFQKFIYSFKIVFKFEAERRSEDTGCFYSITYLKTSTFCIFLREF
jgi:hypothetical protein